MVRTPPLRPQRRTAASGGRTVRHPRALPRSPAIRDHAGDHPQRQRRRTHPSRRHAPGQTRTREAPRHQGQLKELKDHEPEGQEPETGRRRLRLGTRRSHQVTRRQSPLRPPTSSRRPSRRGTAEPLQPLHGHAVPLPPERVTLTTKQSLSYRPQQASRQRRLGAYPRGMSCRPAPAVAGHGDGPARCRDSDTFQNSCELGAVAELSGGDKHGLRPLALFAGQVDLGGRASSGPAQAVVLRLDVDTARRLLLGACVAAGACGV